MPFSILYVCTGNICRSPFAQLLTRARLDAALGTRADDVSVASVGIRGMVGHPMDATAAAQLLTRGIDADGFRARELRPRVVTEADLILTATMAHRKLVLEAEPRGLRRTFTITEFADLARIADPAETPQDLVAMAAGLRGRATPQSYDVPDPIGGAEDLHAQVAATIAEALDPIIEAVVATLTTTR
ncbi:MAG: hypothetical protein M3419_12430 [Actinomycetota bacterium]|nr:hypothetical protein [Actinomycetota bacterium]